MSPNTRIVQCDLARRHQAMRNLDALPWAPRPSIISTALGWILVVLVICAFLLGLFAVGAK